MKKIMIAVAMVCAAAMAQAAVANWKVSAMNVFDGMGDSAARYSGTAYFFDANSLAQTALFDLFAKNTKLDLAQQTGYLASGTVASGTISSSNVANQFSAFEQASGFHDFYFVLVNDNKMFLSNTKSFEAGGNDSAVSITFGSQMTGSKLTTEGFSATGQWAAVPEPTSGLLLLIGMGALALRRKRA